VHDSGGWVIVHVLGEDEEKGRKDDEKEMHESGEAGDSGEAPFAGWDVLCCDQFMGPGDCEGSDVDVFEVLREVD
jgi:hypothetical protein